MTSPEHHTDGAHVNSPQAPTPAPTSLRPGDENDWQPGETEADREARLRQLGAQPEGGDGGDLAGQWAEQQSEPNDA